LTGIEAVGKHQTAIDSGQTIVHGLRAEEKQTKTNKTKWFNSRSRLKKDIVVDERRKEVRHNEPGDDYHFDPFAAPPDPKPERSAITCRAKRKRNKSR
jgi:hypothetical protein